MDKNITDQGVLSDYEESKELSVNYLMLLMKVMIVKYYQGSENVSFMHSFYY